MKITSSALIRAWDIAQSRFLKGAEKLVQIITADIYSDSQYIAQDKSFWLKFSKGPGAAKPCERLINDILQLQRAARMHFLVCAVGETEMESMDPADRFRVASIFNATFSDSRHDRGSFVIPIDNNWLENQVRPWVLGRKNWLFVGSLRSGQRDADVTTLIQSAKVNGLDPRSYLKAVLERLHTVKHSDLDGLLPHN